jgi:Protein of unknown function (DUF2851)
MSPPNRYAEMRVAARVRERALFLPLRIPNELEFQARWFAGEFGKQFVTSAGDKIDIVQFGTWNREAGPDFRDAAIRINAGEPLRGCIEIDVLDRNWETHGHAVNPQFDDTVLHVFIEKSDREFFTRTSAHRNVAQVRIEPSALPEAFSANIPLARPGRCQAPLKGVPEERVRSVLDAAAQFRLQRKAARIRAKIDSHGRDEALFQEIAAALGYKENKLPFTLIAQRLTLKSLRENSGDAEALLFGLAGFLEAPDLAVYKKSTRAYVRELWDRWWPHRDDFQRIILPTKTWRIVSTRPSNHPQRRLAALSIFSREWSAFQKSLMKYRAADVGKFLHGLDHPFWKSHYTLTAEPAAKEMALIGKSRSAEILANAIFPFWHAHESASPARADLTAEYAKLPAQLSNRTLETAATRLFGDDPRQREFLKTVAHQQGLLQIYEDFCLQDNSDCAQCPFPEQMQKWK